MSKGPFTILNRVVGGEPNDNSSHLFHRSVAPLWLRNSTNQPLFSRLVYPNIGNFLMGAFLPGQFVVATREEGALKPHLFTGRTLNRHDWVLMANSSIFSVTAVRGDVTDVTTARSLRENRSRNYYQHPTLITFQWQELNGFNAALYELTAEFVERALVQPPFWSGEKLFLLSDFDQSAFINFATKLKPVILSPAG